MKYWRDNDMTTFKEAYLAGKVDSKEIDNWVTQWHDGYLNYDTLHEALGMTRKEYSEWGTTPSTLDTILWCWKADKVLGLKVFSYLGEVPIYSRHSPEYILKNMDSILEGHRAGSGDYVK